ncbi:hypothetical protein [Streptomyces sp. DSM 40750]|uniref:hypothetical protein n=1 Tax=Streptomyces sp. DSM 40750 TaxID=2801030 RepID=UPI00214B50A1|nr:hypothetical protein [Streptomyces sp. DSM 40750]UUU23556.1 hypothetical protein JIX55_26680 [Streptomyces sp. DSM 40750]
MHFVSHALEWVRALLFRAKRPVGKAIPDRTAQAPAPTSPDTRVGMLVLPCLCRAGRVPVPLDAQRDRYDAHPLVRAYVLQPEERQPAVPVRDFAGVGQ